MPQVDSYDTDGPVATDPDRAGLPDPAGRGRRAASTPTSSVPGFAATWFTGLVDTLLARVCHSDRPGQLRAPLQLRRSPHRRRRSRPRAWARRFIREIHERTVEDVEVWEAKAYVTKPALAHGDGPIMQYRRWCEQFYAEGVDRSRTQWEPQADTPAGTVS